MTSAQTCIDSTISSHEIRLSGRVQGVGFRPFVYRLARQHDLHGEVRNIGGELLITVQGKSQNILHFVNAIITEAPSASRPQLIYNRVVTPKNYTVFSIVASQAGQDRHVHVPPDYYLCDKCRAELDDPQNRRYAYPFINCTQCGPRYTLIKEMPYDRNSTSMATFTLCPQCQREYHDVNDRRFHAEPIACPVCGPQIIYKEADRQITNPQQALDACIAALAAGKIVAIKGIGGYHLCCDAHNEQAIASLRTHKSRPDKPLAIMFPYLGKTGVELVTQHVELDDAQAEFLCEPSRPILLAARHPRSTLPESIAPGLDELGVMLAYSPLHHLLLEKLKRPIVATSANISGEPVLIHCGDVEARLANVTQCFLHHDRDIVRPADDSVFRFIAKQARPLRIGRGVAPLELTLPFTLEQPLLACGGQMKNTIALAFDNRVVISPHIGDMGSVRSQQIFEQAVNDLQLLYQVEAKTYVCDAHPNYATSQWARQQNKPVIEILHHHAHAACLPGEYPHEPRWLIFAWDGVGYGDDVTLWGGETFVGQAGHWQRIASMRPFHLPGGEKCAREPWRTAMAISWEMQQQWVSCPVDTDMLYAAWQKRINTPQTTAVGRLFDAAAALLGVSYKTSYEGQAPMQLETIACTGHATALPIPLQEDQTGLLRADWQPLYELLLRNALPLADAARLVHESFAQVICDQAIYFAERYGDFAVGLCGGVFQNKLLTELVSERIQQQGHRVYIPQQIPVNDGGLCFGQIVDAAARI